MSSNNPGCLSLIFGVKKKQQPVIKKRIVPASLPVSEEPKSIEQIKSIPRYASKGNLLTNAEISFFHVLRSMTKDYLVIFPHVALRDLVSVVVDQSEYYTYFNKIDRKQVDFVLCDPKTLRPLFVIELDDSSHSRPDRIERDKFVEKVLEDAKIEIVRVPVAHQYNTAELGALFGSAVSKYKSRQKEEISSVNTLDNPPLCPKHGMRMVLRTAKQTSERFWGCPNYPHCREIIRLVDSSAN